jgi:hypothetical protein
MASAVATEHGRSLMEQPGIEKGSDMSDAVSPTLYVIQSKISNSDWVLTAKPDDSHVHLDHNAVDPRQLWVREDDAARGGFFLRNPFLDRCLRAGSSQGGQVTLAPKSMADAEFIWRKEQGDNWGCLNKLSDWEQKLNVAGNGPYNESTAIIQYGYDRGSDHELWKLVQYDPNFGPTAISYDTGRQQLVLGEPITADVTNLDNRSSTAQLNATVTLHTTAQKTETHSVSDTTQNTLAVALTFGAKFSIEKVFEVSESGTVTETQSTSRTVGSQSSVSTTIDISASANIVVAPGKNYNVSLMARRCTLTIPYTATVTRRAVNGKPGASYTISGTYRYENAYRYDVVVMDAGNGTSVPHAVSAPTIRQTIRGT